MEERKKFCVVVTRRSIAIRCEIGKFCGRGSEISGKKEGYVINVEPSIAQELSELRYCWIKEVKPYTR